MEQNNEVEDSEPPGQGDQSRFTRRRFVRWGVGGAVAVVGLGVLGYELVDHGVLPGKQTLDSLTGACDVASPDVTFASLGGVESGQFLSKARNRSVGYTIGYPPGHGPGSQLPLIVMLHGFGGDHTDSLSGITNQQAVAMQVSGQPLPPMALVTVDGGGGYWTPHPGDDPQGMVVNELLPLCQSRGLGAGSNRIGLMGISMGAVGALRFMEAYPQVFSAVAAISPAVWTSYPQAHAANAGAYASSTEFAANDVITHAHELRGSTVRVAAGVDDPFYPGVQSLVGKLPAGAVVDISGGCHTAPFFESQQPPSLTFLGSHLAG